MASTLLSILHNVFQSLLLAGYWTGKHAAQIQKIALRYVFATRRAEPLVVGDSVANGSLAASIPSLLTAQPALGTRLTTLLCVLAVIAATLIPSYATTYFKRLQAHSKQIITEPPALPYMLPGIGNLILFLRGKDKLAKAIVFVGSNFIYRYIRLLSWTRDRYGFSVPAQFRLGPFKAYVVSDTTYFDTLLHAKGLRGLRSDAGIMLGMKLLFGLNERDQAFYDADTSGISHNPAPSSNVEPQDRIHFLRHAAAVKYFNTTNVRDMTQRFLEQLGSQFADRSDIGSEWVTLPDFSQFVQKEVFKAATYAMCGPYLCSLNPTFVDDFNDYIAYLPVYASAIPRWMSPKAYAVRDKLLAAYKRWHRFALEKSPLDDGSNETWEPYWGTRLVKERFMYSSKMAKMTPSACAAEDLGLLFA